MKINSSISECFNQEMGELKMNPLYNNDNILLNNIKEKEIAKIIDILHSYFHIGSDSEAMIEYMNCAEEILEAIEKEDVHI